MPKLRVCGGAFSIFCARTTRARLTKESRPMFPNSALKHRDERVPLVAAAAAIGMSPNGLFYILQKTNSAIRDDGRWYCTVGTIERIRKARSDLGAPVKTMAGGKHPPNSQFSEHKRT
jgi:hypothetical protein